MARDKTGVVIGILVLLVIVLAGAVAYAFLVKPAVTGYVVNAQNQGIQYTIGTIVSQIQQQGYAQLPVGNQTLYLAPFNPQQQAQQQTSVDATNNLS